MAWTEPTAIEEAERWLLENRTDARKAWAVEQAESARRTHSEQEATWRAAGEDDIAYITARPDILTVSEVAAILGLASARDTNRYLTEWGLQAKKANRYVAMDAAHGGRVTRGGHLRWTTAGLKAI